MKEAEQKEEIIKGLNKIQVLESRKLHGKNSIDLHQQNLLFLILKDVVTEPMFLLLVGSSIIYLVLGEIKEAVILFISLLLVAGISIFQEYRSRNAIKLLKKITASRAKVIRDGNEQLIEAEDLVVGDLVLLEEGNLVPADGVLLQSNDFELNESILTGESLSVKKSHETADMVYGGTLVISGSACFCVHAVGLASQFGKIGLAVSKVKEERTPLQQQIRLFVRNMVWVGGAAFFLVVGIHFYRTQDIIVSLLQGFTLGMSILPEEIPVAFSVFQALGALRLLRKNNILVKKPRFVETLGSATVICVDKTGTITQNKMSLVSVYNAKSGALIDCTSSDDIPMQLIEMAIWSSETKPFDPMEKAIHAYYESMCTNDLRKTYKQVHEYPLAGKPPMMTHVFENDQHIRIIAVKGAPEAILDHSNVTEAARKEILNIVKKMASSGLRVLGVGQALSSDYLVLPQVQTAFTFNFLGLIAFQDPPKESIKQSIQQFHEAGIEVKMITGDYAETAVSIANQIDLIHNNKYLTGDLVMQMSDDELCEAVKSIHIFARMFPEAKLKVVEALKRNGEIVAMTGDGVNDGPALKAAHISIAMGVAGSELAKSTASLVLTDDDVSHMTDAVAMGRKIYDNLKKAIRYIISIHIPIIGIVAVPLLFSWSFSSFFSPIHVIFLELIMGPTCSIVFENEPMEEGTMQRNPLRRSSGFLTFSQLGISIIQGVVIGLGCLSLGYFYMKQGADLTFVRTLIFITLLFSNVFLTLVNRSFLVPVWKSFSNKNKLIPYTILFSLLFIFLATQLNFLRELFELERLNTKAWFQTIGVALASVCWLEGYKLWLRIKAKKS